ncbi:MAG: hypothetical protein U0414_02090 [Polyangiaceae bacterium]
MGYRARAVGLVGSIGVHLVFVGVLAAVVPMPSPKPPRCTAHAGAVLRSSTSDLIRPAVARARRIDLVRRARALRDAGDLRIGAFLLAANAIDAAEEGADFDLQAASQRYQDRIAMLVHALRRSSVEVAVAKVFGDLAYTGLPGGRMGDVLLTGSGSCEPISHLIAAALYDAGHTEVLLRYYGGRTAGVSHLAPVIDTKKGERDLVLGALSRPGGAAFPVDELVESYARTHGLARVAAGGGARPPANTPDDPGLYRSFATKTRTMTAGYPANEDRFTGALPLYNARALASVEAVEASERDAAKVAASDPAPEAVDLANNCSAMLRAGELDPPEISADGVTIDLYRAPSPAGLERVSANIARVEEARANVSSPARRAVMAGCLVGLYGRAAIEFALGGDARVADRATLEIDALRKDAARFVELLARDDEAGASARRSVLAEAGGEAWVLLFLPNSDAAVLALARDAKPSSYDLTTLLTTLLIKPTSRAGALEIVDALPLDRQIEVMHELGHAHENTRPWTASYELELPDGARPSPFVTAYRVFLPMSWRLWEAVQPEMHALDALEREAAVANLPAGVIRALVGYYVRNSIWLHVRREGGAKVIHNIDTWLRVHGYGAVDRFDEIKPSPVDMGTIKQLLADYEAGRIPDSGDP